MLGEISKEEAEVLFKQYSDYVFKTALFLTKSRELADDITQETFLQVFKKYNSFNQERPIKPWIYKIALNITRNMLRRQKWLVFFDKLPEAACSEQVESVIISNENERILWEQINALSQKSKEIIILHFYSGMKLKEIADVLNIPLGTCKSRLNFALNKLRKQLSQNESESLSIGGECYEIS